MNNSSYEGCSCHLNPPCSYCENTFECDNCGNRFDVYEQYETEKGFVCEGCMVDSSDEHSINNK